MKRHDLAAVALALLLLASVALPALHGAQDHRRVTACAANLSTLWKIQYNYINSFGGTNKLLPLETGEKFWLKLAEIDPPLVDKKSLGLFQCPVENVDDAGCDYRGPAANVNKSDDGAVVGADVDGNHGTGRGGNVLLKYGGVQAVRAEETRWKAAETSTTGGNKAVPPKPAVETAKQKRALTDLGNLAADMALFRDFVGHLPESLDELVTKPKFATLWPEGGFIVGGKVPKDPWGADYRYDPATGSLSTLGSDGKPDGDGEAADLDLADIAAPRAPRAFPEWGRHASAIALPETPKQSRAVIDLAHLAAAVFLHHELVGRLPTTLDEAAEFLEGGTLPKDPWGRSYVYDTQGLVPQLFSYGADGERDGEGESGDISTYDIIKNRVPAGTILVERPLGKLPEGAECRGYIFAQDGRSVAFIARKGDKECVVHNGVSGPEFPYIPVIALSANGKVPAYGTQPAPGKVTIVVGAKQWDDLKCFHTDVLVSSDGAHFLARVETKEGWSVMVDGKLGSAAKTMPALVSLAEDGGYGYIQAIDDQEHVVINGVDKGTFEQATCAVGTGGTYAYVGDDDDGTQVVHNGKKLAGRWGSPGSIALSRDGKELAVITYQAKESTLWFDGSDIPLGAKGLAVRMSAGGERVSFWLAAGGQSTPCLRERTGYNVESLEGGKQVVIDPDAGFLKEEKEKFTAVVRGEEVPLPGYVGGFVVTKDAIGYGAVLKGEVVWRVMKRRR